MDPRYSHKAAKHEAMLSKLNVQHALHDTKAASCSFTSNSNGCKGIPRPLPDKGQPSLDGSECLEFPSIFDGDGTDWP